ncbi:MAG: rod shape-determining protein RodA [Parcubacteria group bacterium]|nr:rod shape-determining protein RodA [Parcubacteria group bacterium]
MQRVFNTITIDWILFAALLPILGAGLLTMYSFGGENYFASRQSIWILVSIGVFFASSLFDWRFLKRSDVLVGLFVAAVTVLAFLFVVGSTIKGAQSWLQFGGFTVQPSDPVKILIILILAKYFSRRHIEIAHIRHIVVSGFYAFVPFALVFLQPDLGSAIIIFSVWLGMVIVAGVSKKHLALVFAIGAAVFFLLWSFVFHDYQKERILTFLNPLTDLEGAGYNAYQSTIAVGSGGVVGKGVGFGTQSRLEFLPEYETDFIFAAFAEEWGFVGVALLFSLFGIVMWRITRAALHGASNFETLYAAGLIILFTTHFVIHIGMNIGLLPVTGTPLPFMSYGGSHLVTEFAALGILMGMRRRERPAHRDELGKEIVGGVM